jgi:hypothetical protein
MNKIHTISLYFYYKFELNNALNPYFYTKKFIKIGGGRRAVQSFLEKVYPKPVGSVRALLDSTPVE